jgi:hypothetical protein
MSWGRDSSEVNDGINALEQGILLSELGNDLSVVGQIRSSEVSVHIRLGSCRRYNVDYLDQVG